MTAERAKQLKQNELTADQTAVRARHEQEIDAGRIQAATQIEGHHISADEQGEGGGAGGQAHADGHRRAPEDEQEEEAHVLTDLPVERGAKTRQKNYTFDVSV